MTAAQWIVMDNAAAGWPLDANLSLIAFVPAVKWAIDEGLIDNGRLTEKGEVWWAEHRHQKPEGVR